ncbi:hypothetical protein BHE74_00005756 [Ensete ventricosum]|nr:hypothetical protein BHE74_00005756 [Ensete ventricosum]RZR83005.1 hypothetical protein BHM03_00009548 [Ensete ventricosum]
MVLMACCSSSSTSSHIRDLRLGVLDLRLGVLDPRSVQSPKAFPFCSGDLYSMIYNIEVLLLLLGQWRELVGAAIPRVKRDDLWLLLVTIMVSVEIGGRKGDGSRLWFWIDSLRFRLLLVLQFKGVVGAGEGFNDNGLRLGRKV